VLEELGFPFDSGVATAELLEKLELLQEALLGRALPFAVPLSLLLDREGRLAAIYRGVVGVDQIADDLGMLELSGEALRDAALPFDGRWYTHYMPIELYSSMLAMKFRERYPDEAIRFLASALDYHLARHQDSRLPAQQLQRNETGLVQTHLDLGQLLAAQGRQREALGHYQQVVALQPGRADAHASMGVILAEFGRVSDAVRHFRRALELDPDDARIHNNLGLVLYVQGAFDEAIVEYRRALDLDADLEETLYNLGVALYMSDRPAAAVEQFRAALDLNPDSVGPLTDCAWILATHPDPEVRDPDEAIRLGARAAELTGNRDATVLDTLAAAYATASRFEQAAKTAEAALALAREAQELQLARSVALRLALYRRAEPYRERAGGAEAR
jgi:Flp pilus assembly protein TadD